ncbi:lytic transglycosylase F, partial [Vibrio sp. DBSS07]|nr:lytic transglycosylase F [Vibrio paucivorans]
TSKSYPAIERIEDLSGKEVWVRASSSYFESLQAVNAKLDELDLPPIVINFIEETLQDYELIEMVNLGHIKATVLDSHKTELWMNVMDN